MQAPSTLDRDREYIRHIIDAAEEVTAYVSGFSLESFMLDSMRCRAVCKMVEIAGEAANKISKGSKEKLAEIPWREMADARNKSVHEYFDIDYAIIYEIATQYLPDVATKLKAANL